MGILDEIARGLGLPGTRRPKKKPGIPKLPDPGRIREVIEEAVDSLKSVKEIPKELMERMTEAEEDFHEADRSFRGSRKGRRRDR